MPIDPHRVVAVLGTQAEFRQVQGSLTADGVEVISAASLDEALLAPTTVFLFDADALAPWPAMLARKYCFLHSGQSYLVRPDGSSIGSPWSGTLAQLDAGVRLSFVEFGVPPYDLDLW